MAAHDSSAKWHRYELKYRINEVQAEQIRAYCRSYLPMDPYSGKQTDGRYPILSIYLDSSDLKLLSATIDRRVERVKLRIRTYRCCSQPAEEQPRFCEIKRKSHGVVYKTRAKVPPEVGDCLLWDDGVFTNGMPESDRATSQNLSEFLAVRGRIAARPAVGVFYTREAYEADGIDRVRVTFDRNLHYGLLESTDKGQREMWWPVRQFGVTLEIKFTSTFPSWIADLVRRADLQRRGICKYLMCSQGAGIAGRLQTASRGLEWAF